MFILDWIQQIYAMKYEYQVRKRQLDDTGPKYCESCETLKGQLSIANQQNEKLLERIMEKPTPTVEPGPPQIMTPIKKIPWMVRKQMLESEDRVKAEAIKKAAQPDTDEIRDFEKEVEDAKRARESQQTAG
jgi:hypothetical protein